MKKPKLPDDIYTASNEVDPAAEGAPSPKNVPESKNICAPRNEPSLIDDPGTAVYTPDYTTPNGTQVTYDNNQSVGDASKPSVSRPIEDYKSARLGPWRNEDKPNKGDSPRSNSSQEFKDNYNEIDWGKNGQREEIDVQKTPVQSRNHPGRRLIIYK